MKQFIKSVLPFIDIVLMPFVYPAGLLLKAIRRVGVSRMRMCKTALLQVGVFPIRNHYFEPLFDEQQIKRPLSDDRHLPGIDLNVNEQIEILECFHFEDELDNLHTSYTDELTFYLDNGTFESGDAEYWYNTIRLNKPKTIIEIGSGFSTLMAIKAIVKNQEEIDGDNLHDYRCKHICIEPFESPWLERTGVSVIRQKVEDVDKELFAELSENDILFIDSSHIIKPQGDVLFEYLELLPILHKGVIVHIHDIFTPKDYLDRWIRQKIIFWNEQYLLEAFLTSNHDWKVIGALNYLHHNHYKKMKKVCPYLTPSREPGSFYIKKTN